MAEVLRERLGGFWLRTPIGRGGMGEVFRAIHLHSSTEVAVKRMLPSPSVDREEFEREVRAIAALDHPCVAQVFDYGVEHDAQGVALPWVAMELVPDTLRGFVAQPTPWPRVRSILDQVLRALAHAHGRGVVHRDLKPSNLLWNGELRLADFGLAHLWREEGLQSEHARSGTPTYMAPEQVMGDVARIGPWTDLYAVGCLGWALTTGGPPFVRPTTYLIARAQVKEVPPTLEPRVPVPSELEAWLRWLLAKSVTDRPASAAEALRALPGGERNLAKLPPWRLAARRQAQDQLRGAGLGLFGIRRVPVVGREAVQDALWGALQRAIEGGVGQAVVLRAPSGAGKSTLARWLAETAAELCGSVVLAITPQRAGVDALARAVRSAAGVLEVPQADVAQRVAELLPQLPVGDREAVLRLVGPEGIRDLGERTAALCHAARGFAARAPVVVWLDDVHASEELLAQASALVGVRGPIVVVATAQEEGLAESARARALLDDLSRHRRVVTMALPRLRRESIEQLMDLLVPLEPATRRALVRRTRGNPLHGTQLLSDLVERGTLTLGPEGYQLAPGARADLPDGLRATWQRRLQGLATDGAALEVTEALAVLDAAVDQGVVRDLVVATGSTVSAEVEATLGALGRRGLAVQSRSGQWSLPHALLREAVMERASATRRRQLHTAAADVLQRAGASPLHAGVHVLEAGDGRRAIDLLESAANDLYYEERPFLLHDLVDYLERAIELLALPALSPERARARYWRGMAHLCAASLDDALVELRAARGLAAAGGHRELEALALRGMSHVGSDRWDFETSRRLLREALPLFADPKRRASAQLDLAMLTGQGATMHEAEGLLADVAPIAASAGDPLLSARHLEVTSMLRLHAGDHAGALASLIDAHAAYVAGGIRGKIAETATQLAEIHRITGDVRTAEAWFEVASRAFRALPRSTASTVFEFNVLVHRLEHGDHEGLEEAAETLLEEAAAAHRALEAGLHLLLAAVAGAREAWVEHVQSALSWLRALNTPQRDFALLAELAARRAPHGAASMEEALWDVAIHQWRGCHREDRALECESARPRSMTTVP